MFLCVFSAQVVLINPTVEWMLESQNVQSILVSFTEDVHARATDIFMSLLPSAMAAKKKTWLIDAECGGGNWDTSCRLKLHDITNNPAQTVSITSVL